MLPVGDGSGRLAVNDLRGLLYLTDGAGSPLTVYMDLRELDAGFDDSMFPNETGLASFAFHPEFATAGKPGYGKLYTAYSTPSHTGKAHYLDDDAASHESVLVEWATTDPGANVFTGSSREVMRVGQFSPNHNSASIGFNPTAEEGSADYGMLYVSFGDGGAAHDPRDFGQRLDEPNGALVRIDPLGGDAMRPYGIPPDNPFLGDAAIADEIWAYGLRHAQHFSWDIDGRLYFTEIGQDQIEEVNIGIAGANYGWRLREGTFATAYAIEGAKMGPVYPRPESEEEAFVYPIAQYDHDEGYAISGGFVYRGSIKALHGKYVFSELVKGRLFMIDTADIQPDGLAEITEIDISIPGSNDSLRKVGGFADTYRPGTQRADLRLGIDTQGELYVLTKGDGWIRKLVR